MKQILCPVHKTKVKHSQGWYGQKVECGKCLAEGLPQKWALKYNIPLSKLDRAQ